MQFSKSVHCLIEACFWKFLLVQLIEGVKLRFGGVEQSEGEVEDWEGFDLTSSRVVL